MIFAALVFLAPALAPADETLAASGQYWVKGAPFSLRVPVTDAWKSCSQLALSIKSKTESFTESVRKPATKSGVAEIPIDSYLSRCKPGTVEISLICPSGFPGPLKVQVLKPLEKTDFDKATPEQLEKIHAILVTGEGVMRLEFYPKKAPNTVRNFLKLSAKGFYDGSPFFRVIKDFMIQGGDPTGTGTGGPGYQIKAEFNDLKHEKGVISMARETEPDTAGCQFFIVHGAHVSHLDRQYTAFGKLLDGLETLDKIASAPVATSDGEASKPLAPVVLKKVILVEKP